MARGQVVVRGVFEAAQNFHQGRDGVTGSGSCATWLARRRWRRATLQGMRDTVGLPIAAQGLGTPGHCELLELSVIETVELQRRGKDAVPSDGRDD